MYGDAYPLGPETDLWRLFAKNLPTRTYENDQMIYWQEEQADCFYCIKKGRVKVFLSSENGMEKTITIVEQGILGEAAFFDHMPVSIKSALPFFIRLSGTASNCAVAPPCINRML